MKITLTAWTDFEDNEKVQVCARREYATEGLALYDNHKMHENANFLLEGFLHDEEIEKILVEIYTLGEPLTIIWERDARGDWYKTF